MRYLISGCNGFIGSVLCARLSELGIETIAVDNGSRGLNDVSRLPHVQYIKADYRTILEEFERFSIDAIFHLAAKTGSLSYPLETLMRENAAEAVELYQRAKRHGVAVFVFPTTSLALGVPDSPYVVSKEAAVAQLLGQPHDIASPRLLLCRFFNVSGAYRGFTERRWNEVHIMPMLFDCYVKGTPFVINGNDYATIDGTPSRDFIHVLDVADYLIYRSMRLLAGDPHDPSQIVHLGRGDPVTVFGLIQTMDWLGYGPISWRIGPRRAFDCGELRCPPDAVRALQAWRELRGMSDIIRDEIEALRAAEAFAHA